VARLAGLDAVKGVAIVMVVTIHAAPLDGGGYHDHIVNGLARLAVPLFLVVSGYLAGLKGASRGKLAGSFWKFLRLHVIYAAFYWLISLLHHGPGEAITLKSVLLRFGAGGYPGQYYFAILVQTYFVAAFLLPDRFWRHAWVLPVSALAAVAGTGVLAVDFEAADPAPWIATLARPRANPVWLWFVYFALGASLGARKTARQPAGTPAPSLRAALALTATGVAVATLTAPDLVSAEFALAFPYSRLPIFLGAALVALALPALAHAPAPRPLVRLGRDSFAVFVFNPALLMALELLIGRAPSPWTSWAYAAFAVCGGLLLATVLRRHAPSLLA
jgi:surface polysaccharide O-acyltransferase-like enzyme